MFAFFSFSPSFLLFLQSDIKNMNLQLGKEKCHWLRTFLASGKLETLLGVCLLNLLFAVRNLGGELQNGAWLQMLLCFSFFLLKEEKIVTASPCALLAASPLPGLSLGYPSLLLMRLMCPGVGP